MKRILVLSALAILFISMQPAEAYTGLARTTSLRIGAVDTKPYLGNGWWDAESIDACWTGRDGKDPEILIPVEAGRDYMVSIGLDTIPLAQFGPKVRVEAYLDDKGLSADEFTAAQGTMMLDLPEDILRGKSRATLRIHSPFFIPNGGDRRTLGLKVSRIEISSFLRPETIPNISVGRARIAVFDDPSLPAHGTPSSPAYLEQILTADGYGVTHLTAAELANPFIFGVNRFDLLILPQGESFPAEARHALFRFLRQGGDFISMGGYAFDNLYYLSADGGWRGREELFGMPTLDPAIPPISIFDPNQELKGWVQASNRPDSPQIRQGPGRGGRKCLEIHTDNLTGWDIGMSPAVPAISHGYNLTRFWAKGDRNTAELSIEWREKDSSRWIAVIPLTTEWKQYTLEPAAFIHWTDGTNRRDEFHPENADSIGFGLAFTHTRRVSEGPHTFWIDGVEMAKGAIENPGDDRINTRNPEPYNADQIGVFDASFKLKWVDSAEADPRQLIVDPGLKLKGDLTGYAAIGRMERDNTRWVPLINGFDRYGRLRGSLGSLAIHHSGTRKGSIWAFFGVDNEDLFSAKHPEMSAALLSIVNAITRGVFLNRTGPEMACYRVGEESVFSAWVSNYGNTEQKGALKLQLLGPDGKDLIEAAQRDFDLSPGAEKQVTVRWKIAPPTPDFCRIRSTMIIDGKAVDQEEAAFCVWDERVLSAGPKLTMKNSRFELDGAPRILFGSNETASFWTGLNENNPLGWDKELQQMADDGLRVIRIHTAPQFFWTKHNEKNDAQFRKLDAWVQLCRKHGIAPYIDLMDWAQGLEDPFLRGGDYYLDPVALEGQREYIRYFVSRYKASAGILYDADNEPADDAPNPTRAKLWNAWLAKKYGTDEALSTAWGSYLNKEKLGAIALDPGPDTFDNLRFYDYTEFVRYGTRDGWVKNFADTVLDADPAAIPSVSGWNIGGRDPITLSDPLSFADNHFYHSLGSLPYFLKSYDLRAEGLPPVIGEFGSTTHPTRTSDSYWRPPDEQVMQFLWIGHYLAGTGGAMLLNWDYRDQLDTVFPWGLHYAGDFVPKDLTVAYRQFVRFMDRVPIAGSVPETVVCVPEKSRLGGQGNTVWEGVSRTLRGLVQSRVDFTLINELHLDKLPKNVKALIYPLPYCPSDATIALLTDFAKRGGALYFSGDISYSPERKYLGGARLQQLAGVQTTDTPDVKNPWEPRQVKLAGAQTIEPDLTLNKLGKGLVVFNEKPIELDNDPASEPIRRSLYLAFLKRAGIAPNPATPESPLLHCFKHPLADGGVLYIVVNADPEQPCTATLSTNAGRFELPLNSLKAGMVILDANGNVTGLEAQGSVTLNGKPIVDAQGHFMLTTLDGLDLRISKAILVLPVGAGNLGIRTTRTWIGPVVTVGEPQNNAWHALEQIAPQSTPGSVSFSWDEIQAPGIFVLSETSNAKVATAKAVKPL